MKKLVLAAALLSPSAAFADFIGVHGSIGSWNAAYKGETAALKDKAKREAQNLEIPTFEERGFSDDGHSFGWIAFEHPIPFLPNIKLSHLSAESEGFSAEKIALERFEYSYPVADFQATASGVDASKVHTIMDLEVLDATLYWELLDNWISLDAGLTIRKLDGVFIESVSEEIPLPLGAIPGGLEACERQGWEQDDYLVNGLIPIVACIRPPYGVSSSTNIDMVLPLIYLKAQFDLPLSGFYTALTAQALSDGDNGMVDLDIELGYMFDFNVMEAGASIGYRRASLDAEDLSDIYADSSLDGYYAGLKFHF